MQRRKDGWHLEIVAFGGGTTRIDEQVAAVKGMKELRQVPLARDGWERREFAASLEGGHEQQPIHVTLLVYRCEGGADFVPPLASADAVLFAQTGDAAIDARIAAEVDAALDERPGSPPRITEACTPAKVRDHLKTIVKRTIAALRAGELHEFWKASLRNAEAAHDEAVFGRLSREKIVGQPPGELVPYLLRVVRERGRRAVQAGRFARADAYDRSLNQRWQRLFAVSALESLVADAGIVALFGAPGVRAMEPDEVAAALSGLRRIGAVKKAAIVERALVVAREAKLWDGNAVGVAATVLEELSDKFYAIDDEPLAVRLEEDVRKSPDDFTLGPYED
jgi:hypothetical protein